MSHSSLYDQRLREHHFYPHVVAYYYKQWDRFRMPFHSHQAVEIMYVISGKCVVELQGALLTLKKGDFILIDAEVKHRLIVEHTGPCRMLNIEFIFVEENNPFPSLKDLIAQEQSLAALLTAEKAYYVLRDPHDIYHTLKSLVLELDNNGPHDRGQQRHVMVYLLLSQLLIRISRIVSAKGDQLPKQADLYVRQSIAFMQQNYDRDIQIKHIAAAVNLHPSYLHRIFKANMDCTIVEYLTSLRIEKAKMLLSQTDIPIGEIADYVGVSSQQYLSYMFRKHTGQSPLAYRNERKS